MYIKIFLMSAGCFICGSGLSAFRLFPCLNASIRSLSKFSCDIFAVVDSGSFLTKEGNAFTYEC